MATIIYKFADGHIEEIEVTEEFARAYVGIEQEFRRNEEKFNWRARKKESSIEKLREEIGFDIADQSKAVDEQAIETEFIEKFTSLLTDKQKIVFRKRYIENKTLREIAEETGVHLKSVQKHIALIHEKFSKKFPK